MTRRIPALGGNPQRTLIVAAWRTGSTFLSQLLASNLKDMRYFLYEPLMAQFRIHLINNSLQQEQTLQLLQKIFHCEYNQIQDPRHYVLNAMYLQNAPLWRTMWNTTREKAILARLQNWTKDPRDIHKRIPLSGRVTNVLRSHQRLVRNYCSIYPHQIIKLVRLPLSALENLLENDKYALLDFCLSVNIVLHLCVKVLNQQIVKSLRNSCCLSIYPFIARYGFSYFQRHSHCLKSPQNVAFEFFDFDIFHQLQLTYELLYIQKFKKIEMLNETFSVIFKHRGTLQIVQQT